MNSVLTILCLIVLGVNSYAQNTNRYIVHFTSKNGTTYSIDTPLEFLSQRAIDRTGRIVTSADFPVNKSYVDGLINNGAIILGTSRWMNGALVVLSESDIQSITDLPYVERINYVAPGAKPDVGGRSDTSGGEKPSEFDVGSLGQFDMLGVKAMHDDGYLGKGMMIAVLDGGYRGVDQSDYFAHLENDQLVDVHNFTTAGDDIYAYSDHGTRVLSTMAASGSNYEGIAPDADYLVYVTEDVRFEYRIEEYNWLLAAERADSIGADIITTSLGYTDFDDASMDYTHDDLDGQTALVTRAAEMAYERGMIVVTSAGNSGNKEWQKVSPPSDGKNILAIGSVGVSLERSSFSSIGPVAADRLKPDLMAMGQQTVLIGQNGTITSGSGTSFAAPQVAGLIAGLWEKYPKLSNAELISLLKSTASRAGTKDNMYGYGVPSYTAFTNYYDQQQILRRQNDFYSIYPNPISGTDLEISIKDPNAIDNIRVDIITTDGKLITSQDKVVNWASNPVKVDVSNLSTGIYLVKVISTEQVMIKRVVKR